MYNIYKYYTIDGKELSKIVQTLPLHSKHYVIYDTVHGNPYQQVDVEQNILMEINLDIADIKVKATVLT